MSGFPNTSINDSVVDTTRGTASRVVGSCILIFLDLAALVGNSLVCLAFYRKPSLRTVTNYFVLSLALTDMSIAVLVIPLNISGSVANKWIAGEFGCLLSYACGIALLGTSLLTLMLLAVNRYLRVTRPALCSGIYSKRNAVLTAVSAWIVTIVPTIAVFSTSVIQFETYAIQPTQCFKFYPNRSSLASATVLFNSVIVVSGLAIVVCYVKVWRTIHQHNNAITISSQGRHRAFGVEEAKVTKILTVIVVGFYVCWLPVFICNILRVFDATAESVIKFWHICYQFPLFAASVINPVIYATMSQPFRKEFLKILGC